MPLMTLLITFIAEDLVDMFFVVRIDFVLARSELFYENVGVV